jgi:Flp pilus assembly pilin Flp
MQIQEKNSDQFETAGPFDTDGLPVALGSKFHGQYQEQTQMFSRCKRFLTSRTAERGASMVEYALLIVLIAIIAFVAVRVAGENVSTAFSSVADGFPTN